MDEKELRVIYQNIDYSIITKETFINAYRVDCQKIFLSKDEQDEFNCKFKKFMFKYLNSISDSKQIITDLQQLRDEKMTAHTYVDFLLKSESVGFLDDNTTKQIIEMDLIPLSYLLYNEKFSKQHACLLKELIMNTENGIEYLVDQYDYSKDNKYKYYLPKLNEEEIDELIVKYLKSRYRNLNVLSALKVHKNNGNSYVIKPERFLAIEKACEDYVNNPDVFIYRERGPNLEVGIATDIEEPFYYDWSNGHIKYVSSKSYIDSNLKYDNYEKILKYSLLLTDGTGRINGIFNPYNENAQAILENRTVTQYGDQQFKELENIRNLHFISVSGYLSNISCPIEKYLEYVVNDRFNKKYGANGFNLSLYIDGSYKVKCEHLFNEMQGLVKQYDSYYRLNTVSKELLNRLTFSSYSAIKSKISGKYYSVNSKGSIVRVLKLLFDYQSVLRYNKRYQNDRLSFAQMIISFDIKRNDYMSEYASNKIDYLIDNEVLIEENSVLKFKNLETVLLLNELYKYGFVVYPYLAENYKKMMNLFLKKEWVQMENTMLSSLESDYFEYYLSDKIYSGNPALRNKYGHGSPITDESETHKDYCVGLKLFTLLIMKFEEEFKILSNRGDKQV